MDTAHRTNLETDGSSVTAIARAGEPDRYLAALLSPPPQREALLALAAFSVELARIPQRIVHEPAMGEVRLQWWRDALALPAGLRAGQPVADAVREAARNHALPTDLLDALIDGRSLLLDPGSWLTEEGLRDVLWKTEGAHFALSARVMGLPASADVEAACVASGYAYGLARLLLGLPRALAQGRNPLPAARIEAAGLTVEELFSGAADARIERLLEGYSAQIRRSLAQTRQFTATLPRAACIAFLPLALVEPYLRVLERAGTAMLRKETSVVPLTRVGRIAVAHLIGRF